MKRHGGGLFDGLHMIDHVAGASDGPLDQQLLNALSLVHELARHKHLDERHALSIIAFVERVYRIQESIPKFEAWCIVKHYTGRDTPPSIWAAFMTKAQAKAFAGPVEEAYHRPHWPQRDRFLVERNLVDYQKLIAPDTTVKEYVRRIMGSR